MSKVALRRKQLWRRSESYGRAFGICLALPLHELQYGHFTLVPMEATMNGVDYLNDDGDYINDDGALALHALLVEDDELDAEILITLAGMNGACAIHFTRARTLAEAARIVAGSKFDMYFVDFHLDEGSSLKLLASLEQAGARPVVVSNLTLGDVERYRLNQGGVRFLSKGDCSPMRISALVRDALQARTQSNATLAAAAE
jgi:CheY-like chemotaxis protein